MGYTYGLLRTPSQSRPHGWAKHSVRSKVSTMALHERFVNTILGLHPRGAPNVCQEPFSWSGIAFVAKHSSYDALLCAVREALCRGCTHWLLNQFDVIGLCAPGLVGPSWHSYGSGPPGGRGVKAGDALQRKKHKHSFHGPLHQGGCRERHGQQSHAFDWKSS